jgi:hypothetical protein
MNVVKNARKSAKSRLDEVEKRICELEDRSFPDE